MPTSFGSDLFVDKINVTRAEIASIDAGGFDPPLPVPTISNILDTDNDANNKNLTNLGTLNTENVTIKAAGTIAGDSTQKAVCTNLDLRDASNQLPDKYDQLITDLAALEARVDALEGGAV